MKTKTGPNVKAAARRYRKIVEWSDEDQCFVGSAPPIIGQCCHGESQAAVMKQLTAIVKDWVADRPINPA
jgi:predicted RNase H-like HicB family nuclease